MWIKLFLLADSMYSKNVVWLYFWFYVTASQWGIEVLISSVSLRMVVRPRRRWKYCYTACVLSFTIRLAVDVHDWESCVTAGVINRLKNSIQFYCFRQHPMFLQSHVETRRKHLPHWLNIGNAHQISYLDTRWQLSLEFCIASKISFLVTSYTQHNQPFDGTALCMYATQTTHIS